MARNLLAESPIETVMPSSRSTSSAKRASTLAALMPCSRSVPVRSRKASSIDSGSTSGVSVNMARAHGAAGLGVFAHVRADNHRLRAAPQRLEHRHGRADAVGARHITSRRRPRRVCRRRRSPACRRARGRRASRWWRRRRRSRYARWSACSSSAWRASRGEPQAGTARCAGGRIGQAIAAEAHGTSRSHGVPPSAA